MLSYYTRYNVNVEKKEETIYSCNIPITVLYTRIYIILYIIIPLYYMCAVVVIVGDLLGRDHNLAIWPTCIPRARI